jgi:DNA repair protein RadC
MENTDLTQVAEVKLVYLTNVKSSDRIKVTSSDDAFKIFRSLYDDETIEHHESVKLMLLNRANKVLGVREISVGGTSGCIIDTKIIFQYCLTSNASSYILSHNHPSGNLTPSDADKAITNKLKQGSDILGLNFLDHIIITRDGGYFSFADEGLI